MIDKCGICKSQTGDSDKGNVKIWYDSEARYCGLNCPLCSKCAEKIYDYVCAMEPKCQPA